jgi:hypothetical protein
MDALAKIRQAGFTVSADGGLEPENFRSDRHSFNSVPPTLSKIVQ